MLFKDTTGKYIIINKSDFTDDKSYYQYILSIKGYKGHTEVNNVIEDLLDIVQNKKEYITYKPNKTNAVDKT